MVGSTGNGMYVHIIKTKYKKHTHVRMCIDKHTFIHEYCTCTCGKDVQTHALTQMRK